MNSAQRDFPASIAIAGAWGYIGRKFLDVALAQGLKTFVYDPGPAPADIDLGRLTLVAKEREFYRLPAEFFHLAVHPEHRRLDALLCRPEPLVILNEKPMAAPGRPADCQALVAAAAASPAILFYDFPELFDPLTARIRAFLRQFRDVRLTEFFVQRSKDREDPALPRNYKRMVPIQYQETVHCLAFVLDLLAVVAGDVPAALAHGVRLEGRSDPYEPPNPEAYSAVVDGRCQFRARVGETRVEGLTDFKRHAPWVKRRVVHGRGDGRPFEIEVSFLEGRKSLRIDGVDQPCDPASNSYEHVLRTAYRWAHEVDSASLGSGLYPNAPFTFITYQLSSALWHSCHQGRAIAFGSAAELEAIREVWF